MADDDVNMDGEEEEEEEKIDPVTLAPELFMACKTNDTGASCGLAKRWPRSPRRLR